MLINRGDEAWILAPKDPNRATSLEPTARHWELKRIDIANATY